MRRPARRVVVHATQVAVLALSTTPVLPALAAPKGAAEARAPAEQVSVRVNERKLHATVRTEPGRVVALAHANGPDARAWTVLAETTTRTGADGLAQVTLDLAGHRDQSVTLALVTASDTAFERDLRATEPAQLVLKGGRLLPRPAAGQGSPAAAKAGIDGSAGPLTRLGSKDAVAAKGLSVAMKGSVPAAAIELDPKTRGKR